MDVRVLYNVEDGVRAKEMAYPAVFISGRNGDSAEKKEGSQCRDAAERSAHPPTSSESLGSPIGTRATAWVWGAGGRGDEEG